MSSRVISAVPRKFRAEAVQAFCGSFPLRVQAQLHSACLFPLRLGRHRCLKAVHMSSRVISAVPRKFQAEAVQAFCGSFPFRVQTFVAPGLLYFAAPRQASLLEGRSHVLQFISASPRKFRAEAVQAVLRVISASRASIRCIRLALFPFCLGRHRCLKAAHMSLRVIASPVAPGSPISAALSLRGNNRCAELVSRHESRPDLMFTPLVSFFCLYSLAPCFCILLALPSLLAYSNFFLLLLPCLAFLAFLAFPAFAAPVVDSSNYPSTAIIFNLLIINNIRFALVEKCHKKIRSIHALLYYSIDN